MEMNFELLSKNLVSMIGTCLRDEELAKLLYYNTNNPLSKPPVDVQLIAPSGKEERIIPYPFDVKFVGDERSQLHVYYPSVELSNNSVVEHALVFFDIVVHKRLWLYAEGSEMLVRPYKIASRISRLFDGSVPTTRDRVGKLQFSNISQVVINEEYHALRLEALLINYKYTN